MNCTRCKDTSQVLRTERLPDGSRRRTRQCNSPTCGYRFVTTEMHRRTPNPDPIDTDRLEAALGKIPGIDREAIAAALRTDRRRAAISRRQAQERAAEHEAGYEDAAPGSLDSMAARRLLRGY